MKHDLTGLQLYEKERQFKPSAYAIVIAVLFGSMVIVALIGS
jgi:hypothetical protein